MAILRNLLLCLATASALVIPRDGAKILSDLQTINADYNALTQANEQFSRDGDAVNVQTKVTKINVDNELTVADAALSGPISNSNAQAIVDYINSTLEPSIKTEIAAAIANKERVAKQGLTQAVALEMTQLKLENDNIGIFVGAKFPSSQTAALQEAISKIDRDYEYGISQFS